MDVPPQNPDGVRFTGAGIGGLKIYPSPGESAAGVLVIGTGVSGLTTALCLRRRGFRVHVVGEKFAPHITSVVAGALWEWPPAVCGYHHDQLSLSRSKEWCMTSYDVFDGLAADPATGVFMRQVNFYFRRPVQESPRDLEKMNELRDRVRGFEHTPALIERNAVSRGIGLRDAYTHLAPMVDTDRYMAWLLERVREAGATVEQGRIEGVLANQEAALQARYGVDAIVNCTGLGARELAPEYMYPLRGALVRMKNDGRRFPRITQAHCVSHDEERSEQDIVFIVPRGPDMLVLGGLAEPDEWSLDIGLDYPPIRDMYERCMEFLPVLRKGELDPDERTRAGLRPFRRANVRLDVEEGTRIVHNYGHGGAGVTFSWGCALEVAGTVAQLLGTGVAEPV